MCSGFRPSMGYRAGARDIGVAGAVAVRRGSGGDGRVKLVAGWLVEQAGMVKGTRRGAVGISSAHALALVHHGGGTTRELLALAAKRGLSLGRMGVEYESRLLGMPIEDVTAEMLRRYDVMRASVERGLDDSRLSLTLLRPSAAALMRAEAEGRLPGKQEDTGWRPRSHCRVDQIKYAGPDPRPISVR